MIKDTQVFEELARYEKKYRAKITPSCNKFQYTLWSIDAFARELAWSEMCFVRYRNNRSNSYDVA